MSQSFIKKPDSGPHSALAGLGVLASERSAQHTPLPVSRAMLDAAMLERIAAQVPTPNGEALCAVAARVRERSKAHEELVSVMDAIARYIGGPKDRFGRPDQNANDDMRKARADILALARFYGYAGNHATVLDQAAAVLRAAIAKATGSAA